MEDRIKNVVIVAGGLNTRMEDLCVFPKVLFPMYTYGSILLYDIEKIEEIGAKPYIVINHDYADMLKQYCGRNGLTDRIEIIVSHNTDGSANTLKAVASELPEDNTLLVWSDLVINDFNMVKTLLNFDYLEGIEEHVVGHVIMCQAGKYRFLVKNVFNDKTYKGCEIIELPKPKSDDVFSMTGNVPGVYWYKTKPDFSKISDNKHNYDYIEFLRDYYPDDFCQVPLGSSISEYRDKQTYIEYITKKKSGGEKARFFNEIEIDHENKTFTKTCKNPEYRHLISKEIDWYEKAGSFGFTGTPRVWNWRVGGIPEIGDSIELEYLEGYKTLHAWTEEMTKEEIKTMVADELAVFKKLHELDVKPVEFVDVQEDYEEEFVDKVLRRCDSISHMLVNYDREKLEGMLMQAFDYLYHQKCKVGVMPNTTYSFIHGDPNGSNVMYDKKTRDIKLIDPRGYFGKTRLYGPEEYDKAKILYFLSGYDDFNKNPKVWNKDLPKMVLSKEDIPEELMTNSCWIMLGIIWISLAQYIGQNIMKANIAYDYGLQILARALDNLKNNTI